MTDVNRTTQVCTAMAIALLARTAASSDFKDSPVAYGDNNHVEVKYDQRVTNQIEHKHFVIYKGPSTKEVEQALAHVLAGDLAIRDDLQNDKEQAAFDKIRAALEGALKDDEQALGGLESQLSVVSEKIEEIDENTRTTKDDVEGIRDTLTHPRLLFGVALGWFGDSPARRWSNGGFGRLDFELVVGDTRSLARHNLIFSGSFDAAQSDQIISNPDGAELDRSNAPVSFRAGGDAGYAVAYGRTTQVVPFAAAGVGGQWFSSALTKDPTAIVGLRTGLEVRFGELSRGFRVGGEYALQSLRQPTYYFRGLSVASSPEREAVSSVRLYLGGYFGVI